DRLIAELCIPGDGPVAALYYGHQLFELPLGVLAVAVATAAFPELARLGARGDSAALGDGVGRALRLVAALAFPAAAGLAVVREPTVRLLFERGLFTPADSARTAAVTFWYALAVAPAALSPVLARAHHARADTRTPVRIALVSVAANFGLNLALVWPMREAGLACATALSCALQAALLARALRGRVPVPWRAGVLPAVAKALGATALSAAAAWGALVVAGGTGPALQCAAGVGAGIGAYLAAALALGSAEIRGLISRGASPRSA
ncbi:MAG: polysaccharide biosynthesis C-terminal domain-containing protein, partial [Planctomycetales bacterium]|nr:polysaccharide biosynthesis C-terminal domain-containing protein [Planctomycetales bacterium]